VFAQLAFIVVFIYKTDKRKKTMDKIVVKEIKKEGEQIGKTNN